MSTFLEEIIEAKRVRVAAEKTNVDLANLEQRAFENVGRQRGFRNALTDRSRINVIAEFKRASPSKGVINDTLDPAETAAAYEKGGAAATSVLTEQDFFRGSLDDLAAVRNAVNLPVLRKDFIVDDFQIYESAAARADAILLIVAALNAEELRNFQSLARELGLDALVEVHDREELDTAVDIGANLIGVNNRNLKTFELSLDVSRDLIGHAPTDAVMITESGLRSYDEISELHELGYNGFLMGETLMRSGDPTSALTELTRVVPTV